MRNTVLVLTMLVTSGPAHASGDPAVIWWGLGAIVIQSATAALLFWLPYFSSIRKAALTSYGIALIVSWLWGLNVPGPDFDPVYVVLLGGPVIFLLLAAALVLIKAKRPE